MASKFDFYEVVKVCSDRQSHCQISGLEGVVLGKSEHPPGRWVYAVQVLDTEEGWDLAEDLLVSTGRKMRREEIYDGSSVRVSVDPVSGKGRLLD